MRAIVGVLLVLSLVMGGMQASVAQGVDSQFAVGIGEPTVWTDADGNAIVILTVTAVDEDFQGAAERYSPDHGYGHRAVTFTVQNRSDDAIIIEPSDFRLTDDFGRLHGRSSVPMADESVETFADAVALAPGETVEQMMVFETPAHASAALFSWEPESEKVLIIALAEQPNGTSAVVWGLDTPAVYSDDFANTVSSFQVTDVQADWSGHSDYDTPDDGQHLVAVHIVMTNETNRPVVIEGRHFRVIDHNGVEHRTSYARAADGVEPQPFRDEIHLEPGESAEAMVVFELDVDVNIVAVAWKPWWALTNMVILLGDLEPVETPVPLGTPF